MVTKSAKISIGTAIFIIFGLTIALVLVIVLRTNNTHYLDLCSSDDNCSHYDFVNTNTSLKLVYSNTKWNQKLPFRYTIRNNNASDSIIPNEYTTYDSGRHTFCIYNKKNELLLDGRKKSVCAVLDVDYNYKDLKICNQNHVCAKELKGTPNQMIYLSYGNMYEPLPLGHRIIGPENKLYQLNANIAVTLGTHEYCIRDANNNVVLDQNGKTKCATLNVQHQYQDLLFCTSQVCQKEAVFFNNEKIYLDYGLVSKPGVKLPYGHKIKLESDTVELRQHLNLSPGRYTLCMYDGKDKIVIDDDQYNICSSITIRQYFDPLQICNSNNGVCHDSKMTIIKGNFNGNVTYYSTFRPDDMEIRQCNNVYDIYDNHLNIKTPGMYKYCIYHENVLALYPNGKEVCVVLDLQYEYGTLLLCDEDNVCENEMMIDKPGHTISIGYDYNGSDYFPSGHTIKIHDRDRAYYFDSIVDLSKNGIFEFCIYKDQYPVFNSNDERICTILTVEYEYGPIVFCKNEDDCHEVLTITQGELVTLNYINFENILPPKHTLKTNNSTYLVGTLIDFSPGNYEFCLFYNDQIMVGSETGGDIICSTITIVV